MNSGDTARRRLQILPLVAAFVALFAAPQAVLAAPVAAPVEAAVTVAEPAQPAAVAEDAAAAEAVQGEVYTPLGSDMIKGQPHAKGMTFQDQYSVNGRYALWMHDAILLPVIVIISLFVLFLLLWVVARFRRGRNAVPSKTSHNTLIEVIWTAVPVLILVVIAIPSMILLSRQYKGAPEDALTIKVTGYQWYWGYSYPDNGGFEIISNMLDEEAADATGEPHQLAVDNRLVVPVGEPIRLQVTAADVIHAFAVPSIWFKIDAVPGRLNERTMQIDEPGIYYGQCSELCGARHAYMPIAIEAVPRPQFEAWVRSKGGSVGGEEAAAAPAPAAATPAADGAANEPAPEAAPAAAPAA